MEEYERAEIRVLEVEMKACVASGDVPTMNDETGGDYGNQDFMMVK